MAAHASPAQHRFFIARADWYDERGYSEDDLFDPSVAAWELLRRNNQYAQDYQRWHHRCIDVPPKPFPKMTLTGYFCYPEPDNPGVIYSDYANRYPDHFVCPVKDYIRERWGINIMPNPEKSWENIWDEKLSHNKYNRLAWLFACNTVSIVNPPNNWPAKNYLQHGTLLTQVSDFCTGTEVMVRLDFTGNLDEQIASLRRQIGSFFTGGDRSGSMLASRPRQVENVNERDANGHETESESLTAWVADGLGPFLAVRPDWNIVPAYRKTLYYLVRMADAIAAMEQGSLIAKLDNVDIHADDLHIRFGPEYQRTSLLSYVAEFARLIEPLSQALFQYFDRNPFRNGELNLSRALIKDWLSVTCELVVGGGYIRLARTNTNAKQGGKTTRK